MDEALAMALTIFAVSPTSPTAVSGAIEYAVVASPDVEVSNLTSVEAKRVFLLERRFWKAGQPIVVLLPPSGSRSRSYLIGKLCRTAEADLRRMILEKMYRGEIELAPKAVASDAEAIAFLAASRGLIAIVPSDMASESVRVLTIDGKLPGTAGYPFRE